jgi:hypothetical protein
VTTKISNSNVKMSTDIIPVKRDTPVPPCGTVIMVNGLTGTAWQRHYNDGLFHSTTGKMPQTWNQIKALKRDDTFIILMGQEQ